MCVGGDVAARGDVVFELSCRQRQIQRQKAKEKGSLNMRRRQMLHFLEIKTGAVLLLLQLLHMLDLSWI